MAAATGQLLQWWRDLNEVSRIDPGELLQCCRQVDGQLVPDDAAIAVRLGDVLPEVVVFCCELARGADAADLPAVAREYSRLLHESYGVQQVEVTTAVPLDTESRRLVEARMRDIAGSLFTLDEKVDPAIIGGIVVRVGDRSLDRSVRARLQSLRQAVLTQVS